MWTKDSKWSTETHGMRYTVEYRAWIEMRRRCYDVNRKGYERYGGRGIKVCDRWMNSFESFFEDMGRRPGKGFSLDRKDNNGNYCKDNCRWANKETQAGNRRDIHNLHAFGETHSISEWSHIKKIDQSTIQKRIVRGWSAEKALQMSPPS